MATEILLLDGTTNEGWPSEVYVGGDTEHHQAIDEAVLDANDYIGANDDYADDNSYTDTFTIPNASVLQEADTVESIEVFTRNVGSGTSDKILDVIISLGKAGDVSGEIEVVNKTASTRWVTFTEDPDSNPWTLAAINDIVGIEVRPGISGADNDDDTWKVYRLYLQINYTVAPTGHVHSHCYIIG